MQERTNGSEFKRSDVRLSDSTIRQLCIKEGTLHTIVYLTQVAFVVETVVARSCD
jgi:hypothetical protein